MARFVPSSIIQNARVWPAASPLAPPFALGLRGRLILLLVTAFAILAGLVGWDIVRDFEERLNAARTELLGWTRVTAAHQQVILARAEAVLNGLMLSPELLPGGSAEACSRILVARLSREKTFDQAGMILPNGDVACAADPPKSPINSADRVWFQQAMRTSETVISDPLVSRLSGKTVLVFGKAVRDGAGQVSSVLYVTLELDWLRREFAGFQLPNGARLVVVDTQGSIALRHPDPEQWTGRSIAHLPLVQRILADGGEGTQEEAGLDGVRQLIAYTPLLKSSKGETFYLWLAIPIQAIEAPERHDALIRLGAMAAVLFGLLGLMVAGSNRLLRPMVTLSQVSARFGTGDISLRTGLPHGGDEIGRLTLAFDQMLDRLESQIAERMRAEAETHRLNLELEDRVRQRTVELTDANRELEAFSYSVSHDLRAPLRAIDGFGGKLERSYADRLDDEGRRLLAVVRDSAQHMGQLIDDLLAISRMGRREMVVSPVDMTRLAREVAEKLHDVEPAERAIEFRVGDLPAASGDMAMLRQVWVNLLSNAIKFTGLRNPARIEIGGQRDGGEVRYWVKDNGVGFDMQYADKLFGVFQRLHAVDEFEGTGVGLALSQRIIRRHGGHIQAEAVVDGGATFTFTLPVAQNTNDEVAP